MSLVTPFEICRNQVHAHYQNNLENKYLLAHFIEAHQNKKFTDRQLYVLVYVLFRDTNALDLLPGFCELCLAPCSGFSAYIDNACGSVQEWNAMCAETGLVKILVPLDIPTNLTLPVSTEASVTAKVNTSPLTLTRHIEEGLGIANPVQDRSGASLPLSDVASDVANSPLLSHRLKMVNNETDMTDDKQKATRLPPASSVPHVGPIFADSKAIIYRDYKPCIHGICGRAFAHPANVRHHDEGLSGGTRKGCKGRGKEKNLRWDDHPSCKIGLKMLNSKSVAEGVVLLDQESLDKVNAAIDAGLAFKDELDAEMDD